MRLLFLLFALTLTANGQFMQAIPAKTPDNCDVRADKMEKWLLDWPNLTRYRQSDDELAAKPDSQRVVFMGDSITDHWDLGASFPNRPYVNRGISGQTTPQMLLRFQQDVVNLKPAAVVILAGTNDIAGNTGPMSNEEIENNFAAMAAVARANNVAVVVQSILPVHNYTERSKIFFPSRSMDKIRALNAWLKDFAARNQYTYVDYFSAMLDDKGMLKKDLADDGLHPNATGYAIMAKMLDPAIQGTITKSTKASGSK